MMQKGPGALLRVLLVEDSEDDALLLLHCLQEGGHAVHSRRVDTRADLLRALDEELWDIAFGDYTMPGFAGTEALALVREKVPDLPFIFVSGTIGEDIAVEAMRAGAQDYLMKGHLKRLLPAVERELNEAEVRRGRRRAERETRLLQEVSYGAEVAADVEAALSVVLKSLCEATDFVLAQAWMLRAGEAVLECSPAWTGRRDGLESFRTHSLSVSFAADEGLPGRVWSSGAPEWVEDVTRVSWFARAESARQAGLGTAFAVPVAADGEVLGVLEFFMEGRRPSDAHLIRLVDGVAVQLGGVIRRKRTEERLNYLAHHDTLTGLPNRMLFVERLGRALLEARRNGRLVGVGLLDLDRFKTINDSLGHGTGDRLLESVAKRLTECVRASDTVARLAGDEFTLILTDLDSLEQAAHVARKILDELARPFQVAGHELYTSGSLGLTLFPLDDGDVERLLRNADIAMYRAKEGGGNTCEFYATDMSHRAYARLELETALRRALERGEFRLHYQPVVDLATARITGVEALIRWQHPTHGLVAPGEFIPVAEETGLIIPLGEWVLREACARLGEINERPGRAPLRLAVNASPRQFHHGDLLGSTMQALEEARMAPGLLDLEITEGLLMRNAGTARETMEAMGRRGIRFSVDDFGTGYSSLSYLKHLPIGSLKIDRSFVRDVPGDANDAAIVEAIISMARTLGIRVIAEGVETPEQLEFLRRHGCDAAQGFYFSNPITNSDLMALLESEAPLPR